MLRDIVLKKTKELKKTSDSRGDNSYRQQPIGADNSSNIDAEVACDILNWLLNQVNESLQRDRSSVKLNMFEKGAVSGGLKAVMPGTRRFILGMRSEELAVLLDGVGTRLAKRRVFK